MELKGTITHALPMVSGTSKAGYPWKKREYVLEYQEGQYPRKMVFTCFGETADRIVLEPGQQVNVFFDLDSREYNGRWYLESRAWRVDPVSAAAPAAPAAAPIAAPGSIPPPPVVPTGAADEEFPF